MAPDRAGAFPDMVERQPNRRMPAPETTQPSQGRAEGKQSLQGPTTVDRSDQLLPQQESQERQPLPSALDYIEDREKLYDYKRRAKQLDVQEDEEFEREDWRLVFLRKTIEEKGTPRDNFILQLYDAKIKLLGLNPGWSLENFRSSLSSLEESQQFRSTVERMSDEQISEAILKQEKQNRREWLATVSPEVKRRERKWRDYQERKERAKLQAEQQQPTQVFPPSKA